MEKEKNELKVIVHNPITKKDASEKIKSICELIETTHNINQFVK